jgi:choline dehydrogenase
VPKVPIGDITPVAISEHVSENLSDYLIMPYVRKLNEGLGAEDHIIRPGPARDAAIAQYNKDRMGPISSGLLEPVGFLRIDKYLETSKEYNEYKAKNGKCGSLWARWTTAF